MNSIVTLENIVKFQDALIKVLEVSKEGDIKAKLFIDSYKSQIESLKDELESQNQKVTRVEIISKKNGREKVVKEEDIELSFQDENRTLKVFYGYSGKEEDIECTGNNGNGCFLDSCGHNCGCKGIKIITNKTETNV